GGGAVGGGAGSGEPALGGGAGGEWPGEAAECSEGTGSCEGPVGEESSCGLSPVAPRALEAGSGAQRSREQRLEVELRVGAEDGSPLAPACDSDGSGSEDDEELSGLMVQSIRVPVVGAASRAAPAGEGCGLLRLAAPPAAPPSPPLPRLVSSRLVS
ncbi:unnamed protein product, partial [Prorocentrum cordatum]